MRWVAEDALIGNNSHSLKGTPKGPMAEATKEKISAGVKQHLQTNPRTHSEETKALIRQANVGKDVSDETRMKQSAMAKEQWDRQKADGHAVSADTRKKISNATKGKPKSPEHRAKIAAAMRARKKNP